MAASPAIQVTLVDYNPAWPAMARDEVARWGMTLTDASSIVHPVSPAIHIQELDPLLWESWGFKHPEAFVQVGLRGARSHSETVY